MLIGMEATTATKKIKPRSKMNIITDYSLQINKRGEIEIASGDKRDVIGLPHRIGMPDSLPAFAIEMIRKAKANPADYCWCGGRAVRNTHRAALVAMITDGRATYSITPAGLRDARAALSDRIRFASDAAADTRTENFHRYDTGAGMGRNGYDAKAEAARAELIAFDAAHPEIKAGIEAEKTESVARNFWN
jgi:hypothetical protein